MRSRQPCFVASDQPAGDTVDPVLGVCQTEIQVLPDHEQTAMQSDGEAGAIGNKVLPAELISDPKPVMCIRIHEIEGVVNAVGRILVSAGKVVAAEDPRENPDSESTDHCHGEAENDRDDEAEQGDLHRDPQALEQVRDDVLETGFVRQKIIRTEKPIFFGRVFGQAPELLIAQLCGCGWNGTKSRGGGDQECNRDDEKALHGG